MSEFQYYEFQALDRPLSPKEQADVRKLSTRAEITSRSFTNEYQWGNFGGKPETLVTKYYDAHLYIANWGTRRLMFRFPPETLRPATVKPYLVPEVLTARTRRGLLIVTFEVNEEAADYYDPYGVLDELVPIRDDLLQGDPRTLYIGWLSGVVLGHVEDTASEPPVPAGLNPLPDRYAVLAGLLAVPKKLVSFAARESPPAVQKSGSKPKLTAWLRKLGAARKLDLLRRVIDGDGDRVQGELVNAYRAAHPPDPAETRATGRKAQDLLAGSGLDGSVNG